jgi:hypothetical protein
MTHNPEHDGGGDEQNAQREPKEAEAHLAEAGAEVKHGLRDMNEVERELATARADLEKARQHPHIIHFTVDGEPFTTEQREWTPNAIIKYFGDRDPATNYLVRIKGRDKESFQGKGEIPIEIHDHDDFQTISTGPTPVSDGAARSGVAAFVAGLHALGHKPTILPGKPDHVMIDYTVATGTHAGKQVRHGFVVPPDFPLAPPPGPHVSPRIHAFKDGGAHPTGGVIKSPDFEAAAGGEWQYWSRPFKDWGQVKKTVACYMSHVWRLWDSQ